MAEPTAVAKGLEQVQTAAKDRRVQVIAGVALLSLGVGFYLGIKLRGPQDWVPPIDAAPKPCADCAEKAATVGAGAVVGPPRQLTTDELAQLAELMKDSAPVQFSTLPVDGSAPPGG